MMQVYEANTLAGALLVVVGGLLCIAVVAWWRRDPEAGFEGVLEAITGFFGRAP